MTVKENNEVNIPFSVALQSIYDAFENIDKELEEFTECNREWMGRCGTERE